jgi:hypothetical protein
MMLSYAHDHRRARSPGRYFVDLRNQFRFKNLRTRPADTNRSFSRIAAARRGESAVRCLSWSSRRAERSRAQEDVRPEHRTSLEDLGAPRASREVIANPHLDGQALTDSRGIKSVKDRL